VIISNGIRHIKVLELNFRHHDQDFAVFNLKVKRTCPNPGEKMLITASSIGPQKTKITISSKRIDSAVLIDSGANIRNVRQMPSRIVNHKSDFDVRDTKIPPNPSKKP